MGLIGLFHWMKEEVDTLKAIRATLKDEKQIEVIDKLIAKAEEEE
jgi:hypothetical protein